MKRKKILSDKEKIILEAIHQYGGAMTAHEIAERTGISYVTVQKYLKKLKEEGIIINIED